MKRLTYIFMMTCFVISGFLSTAQAAEDKPEITEVVFLADGQITSKTGIGNVTIEIKFNATMDTEIDPEIHYSLDDNNFALTLPARGGWESDSLWQGDFTISSNLPSTGDGLYYFRINGATGENAVVMDTTLSSTTLEICRPAVEFSTDFINFGYVTPGATRAKQLIISNPGCDGLTIQSVSIDAPFFISNFIQNYVIEAEGELVITLGMLEINRNWYDDSVKVVVPQLRPNTYYIPVSAIVRGPRIVFGSDNLDFGKIDVGADSSRNTWVTNVAADSAALSDTLRIRSISTSVDEAFSVDTSSLTIAPGDTKWVKITFAPQEPLNYTNERAYFVSDDSTRPTSYITLSGDALDRTPPPPPPGLSANWGGSFNGYTNLDMLQICWNPVDDPSGVSQIRWKFSLNNVAPTSNDDLGEGGFIELENGVTCARLPLFGRLVTGRWNCFVWFVDGNGNSGYQNAVYTGFNYDITAPGKGRILTREISAGTWFSEHNPFRFRFILPADGAKGWVDAFSVRWNYSGRPSSATVFDGQWNITGGDTVDVTIPFEAGFCAQDTLFVWLADSVGNSDPNAVTAIPYKFDGCPPVVSRPGMLNKNSGMLSTAFQDTVVITDDTEVSSAKVHYRFGGAESEEPPAQAIRIAGTDSFIVKIPAGAMTRRGLEYRVVAEDQFGHVGVGPYNDDYCYTGDDDGVWFPVRVEITGQGDYRIDRDGNPVPLNAGGSVNNYQMISIPYELQYPSLDSVLADDLGDYDDTEWRLFDYDETESDDNKWVEGKDARDFTPGRSFFIITRKEDVSFDAGPGRTVGTVCPDTLILVEGWNFIATPFNFPVHKNALTLLNSNSNLTLRSFEAGWNITDVLEPWRGYALYVQRAGDAGTGDNIMLVIQPKATSSRAEKAASSMLQPGEWSLRVRAEANGFLDHDNWLGERLIAQPGMDSFDLAEPPNIGEYTAVAFLNENGLPLSADFRSLNGENKIWQLNVTSTMAEFATELKFDFDGTFPTGKALYLIDEEAGVKQNLLAKSTYTVTALNKNLNVITGDAAFVAEQTAHLAEMPTDFRLEQNYPNPFNPETRIHFALPEQAQTQVVIYDQLGRQVRVLSQADLSAGFHTLTWNGLNAQNQPVPSGVYFCKIVAGKHTATRKMLLLR